jgi:hypothetical protein
MKLGGCRAALAVLAGALAAQQTPAPNTTSDSAPIYRVTVERKAIWAVNYGHRGEPTRIDFNGTPLLPKAHGDAKVEARTGAVDIDAKFDNLDAPTRFGAQYLTYVLWAITPDGRPVNLGEIVTNHSDKGRLHVTTPLQAFGLIVTAEPYFAVERPSDIVVAENVLRPDTQGKPGVIEAKYELLRRGDYPTVTINTDNSSTGGREVSQDEYEAVVAVYQAQNALQIARAAGADKYAADTLQRADELYRQARQLESRKGETKRAVMLAREAAQAAEDARAVAARHTR